MVEQRKLKVLYITNLPSPYVVDFLNELGLICQLTAIFECSESTEREDRWKHYVFQNFEGHILNGIRTGVDNAFSPGVLFELKKGKYDGVIVANPCTPTGILATTYMKIRGIPYIIESEGGFAKNGRGIKERIKRFVLSGARLYISTGKPGDEYFIAYGAKQEQIVHFPFTTLYKREILTEVLTDQYKTRIKDKLGCKSNFMILSVGQFIHRKGMDILMQACKNLEYPYDLFVVGGESTEEYIQIQKECKIHNLHFVSYADKELLRQYYQAADVFVLATREDTWGLVIPEAMSFGVPVISTKACAAAVTLIKDRENGFVIAAEDVAGLKQRIDELFYNEELRKHMAEKNIEVMQDYSIEAMAKRQIEEISRLNEVY